MKQHHPHRTRADSIQDVAGESHAVNVYRILDGTVTIEGSPYNIKNGTAGTPPSPMHEPLQPVADDTTRCTTWP